MKKTLKLLVVSLFILSTFSCSKDEDTIEPKDFSVSAKEKQLMNSDNIFGLELFNKTVNSEENKTNVMVSPLSIALALGMTYNGADGTTKDAMEETLNLSGLTVNEINTAYKHLIKELKNADDKVIFNIANSIWYRNSFSVEQDFFDVNKNYFDAEVSPLDFSDPDAKDIINAWVAEKTNDKIKKIIENIDPTDVMFLINAIYFKGSWKYEFDTETTNNLAFYFEDGTHKDVPMMSQKGNFNYHKTDIFQAVELPYGRGNFSMVILVPANDKNTDDILTQLNTDNWNDWLSSMTKEEVNIFLPKFKFEYEITLNDILKDMGMSIAFTPSANFSKINSTIPLCITEVKHKTFIDVNEEGTEAAAVTSVGVGYTSVPSNPVVNANKAFIFAIKEKNTNSIIFIGKIANPIY